MAPNLQRLLKRFGYPVFGVFAFFTFFTLVFPYDRLAGLIEDHAAASGDMTLDLGSVGPGFPFGISADDVRIRFLPKAKTATRLAVPGRMGAIQGGEATEDKPKPKVQIMRLDEVDVDVSLIGLLFGNIAVDFDVEGLGGEIAGSFVSRGKSGWEMDAQFEDVEARRIPHLQGLGPPVRGRLMGSLELKAPENRLSAAEGELRLECAGATIGDGKAKLKLAGNPLLAAGLTLPKVALGRIAAQVSISKGRVGLDKVFAKSPDMEAWLEGHLTLHNRWRFSSIDAYLRFRVGQQLTKRAPEFELIEGALSAAKRSDGFFGLRITGLVNRPSVRPSSTGPAKAPKS